MDVLIHSANVIYLVSYIMRDILWLRIFTVIAATCLIAYFYLRPDPLLTAVYWNLLFIALNVYWIVRLVLERRPVELTPDQQQLCELVFHTISPRQMLAMLKRGEWRHAEAGECFQPMGTPMDRLIVIFSGQVGVDVNGRQVGEIVPGQFVGSISFVTDDPSPASFTAMQPTRYVEWRKSEVKPLLTKDPGLGQAIQATLGIDLASQLRAAWSTDEV